MLFAVITENKPDSVALRASVREEHLAWLDGLGRAVVLAGPILDADGQPCAGLMVFDAGSRDEVEAMVAADPYTAVELFSHQSVRPFSATYRDGVRKG